MLLRERSQDAAGVSVNHHALSVYHWYNANRDVAERHAAAAEEVLEATHAAPMRTRDLGHLGHALAMQAYLAVQANDIERARRPDRTRGRGRRRQSTIRPSPCGRG